MRETGKGRFREAPLIAVVSASERPQPVGGAGEGCSIRPLELFVRIQVWMGLWSGYDPGKIRVLTIGIRPLVAAILGILPLGRFLLPLFLERLLAYALGLRWSGAICHPLHFRGSRCRGER